MIECNDLIQSTWGEHIRLIKSFYLSICPPAHPRRTCVPLAVAGLNKCYQCIYLNPFRTLFLPTRAQSNLDGVVVPQVDRDGAVAGVHSELERLVELCRNANFVYIYRFQ